MNANVWVLALADAVGFAVVLSLAAFGGLLNEKSGVINLGTEGMMLVGACAGFFGARWTDNPWIGLLLALVAGAALAVPHAILCVSMRSEQIVAGLALVIFGSGIATFFGDSVDGQQVAATFKAIELPGLSDIPILGPVLFTQDAVYWITLVLAAVIWWMFARTRLGLAWRAVGESPAAADTQGIAVAPMRYWAVILGGALAGAAGGELQLARLPAWSGASTTNGLGFIALALVVFAGWRVQWIMVGAVLFAFVRRANFTVQNNEISWLPDFFRNPSVLTALPYVLTIVVLFARAASRGGADAEAPAALGRPYVRSER